MVASSRSSDPVDLATGADLSCSSDDDKGNYGDISTFVRPQKRATTVAVKTEIAAEHLAQGPPIKLSTSSEAISDESQQTKVVARTKNFRMDNEMKNFDPAEWRNERALSKSGSTIKSSGVVNCGTDIAAPLPFKAAAAHVQLSHVLKSNTLNRNQSVSDDDSDDEDTCRLDISICDTQKISIKSSSSSNKRSTADTEDEITFKKKPPPSQDKISIINSLSNSNDIKVCNDKKINTDVCGLAQLNDENNPKKCKKVSFASHFDSDKKTLSSNQENLRLKIKTVEKVNNNHDYANNNDNNNNNEGVVTVVLNNVRYTRLNVLGKGGSSCVYRVLSQSDSQLYAYKRVEVKGCLEDSEAMFDSYINEIDLLRRLKGSSPYIIELVDAEINREELYIAIIMEAGDIDLSKVLSQKQTQIQIQHPSVFHQNSNINQNLNQNLNQNNLYQNPSRTTSTSSNNNGSNNNNNSNISCSAGIIRPANAPTSTSTSTSENKAALNPFFIRLMWLEMLEAVDHIHANRIVHGMSGCNQIDATASQFCFIAFYLYQFFDCFLERNVFMVKKNLAL